MERRAGARGQESIPVYPHPPPPSLLLTHPSCSTVRLSSSSAYSAQCSLPQLPDQPMFSLSRPTHLCVCVRVGGVYVCVTEVCVSEVCVNGVHGVCFRRHAAGRVPLQRADVLRRGALGHRQLHTLLLPAGPDPVLHRELPPPALPPAHHGGGQLLPHVLRWVWGDHPTRGLGGLCLTNSVGTCGALFD